jgi:hypothetical protein
LQFIFSFSSHKTSFHDEKSSIRYFDVISFFLGQCWSFFTDIFNKISIYSRVIESTFVSVRNGLDANTLILSAFLTLFIACFFHSTFKKKAKQANKTNKSQLYNSPLSSSPLFFQTFAVLLSETS